MARWQTCMWQTDGEVRLDLDWSNCSSGPAGGRSFGKVKCVGPTLTNIERREDPDPSFDCICAHWMDPWGALVAWRVGWGAPQKSGRHARRSRPNPATCAPCRAVLLQDDVGGGGGVGAATRALPPLCSATLAGCPGRLRCTVVR